MAYTSINKSSTYIKNLTYAGNGSTNAITGVGFQPDLTWIKDRIGSSAVIRIIYLMQLEEQLNGLNLMLLM